MRSAAAHRALQQLLARRSFVAAGRPSTGFPRGRPVRLRCPPSSSPATPISFSCSLAAGCAQRRLVTSVFPAAPHPRRRFSDGVGVRAAQVNDPGAIDSPLMQAMEKKIKEQLNADIVVVKDSYGDGRHVRNANHLLVSPRFPSCILQP
ncbi:hypothetical protein Taro_003113 [Colocasia esculenta]|uniref:Uncharacterized protein n=1 Tax=Colocasia esculenta TaxID=4460 RepID=A0A843TMU1_COLES|nr:hypothetical protein [Colocasia esculenta]